MPRSANIALVAASPKSTSPSPVPRDQTVAHCGADGEALGDAELVTTLGDGLAAKGARTYTATLTAAAAPP